MFMIVETSWRHEGFKINSRNFLFGTCAAGYDISFHAYSGEDVAGRAVGAHCRVRAILLALVGARPWLDQLHADSDARLLACVHAVCEWL